MTEPAAKPDYRNTVFLPKTDFPMKAGLPQKEPGILARWQAEGLYEQTRAARAGAPKFILHDGPPYANGDIHVGHALNHVLKDMVVRTQTLLGKDAPYVPGWDCHGLPIEWKVEEEYRKKKRNKDEVPPDEFRAECRAYAAHWVDVQREQLKRLGIGGDWDHPYLTMDFASEATIVGELMKFAEGGQLYRGAKPVMWSPVEKTALAEAEIEYEDIVSTQVDVAFEITACPNVPELVGAYAVIWTTTPWTIPVNQAIAYGPEVEYVAFRVFAVCSGSNLDLPTAQIAVLQAKKFVVAKPLVAVFLERYATTLKRQWFGLDGNNVRLKAVEPTLQNFNGSDLAGTVAEHPMAKYFRHPREGERPSPDLALREMSEMDPRLHGDDESVGRADKGLDVNSPLAEFFLRPRPFLPGDFVTTDAGTGLVHMAPDHGEDDFALCKEYGIAPVFAVEGDGKYRADWPWLGGEGSVINPKFNAPDGPICTALRESGGLLAASADYRHSYPHSWRSKAKVIYRCTPQWFVPMDREQGGETLRGKALAAISDTRFVPDKGRNRIGAMVEGRPDWVLSRQRAWGVPITLFVDRRTGQYLVDAQVNARIVAAIRESGVDAWSDARAAEYLGDAYDVADYERVTDILDVWFDSGSTHAFVLDSGRWPDLRWPADLYLEGSDQHRGWFQSSLLESCATRGRAPYDAVLTHGFTMDARGEKMSKSKGNTVSPLKVMEQYGADIIRLWALSVDYTEDHRIGDEILKGVADQYRKLRNTFRYLLGALDGFDEAERVGVDEMPELERYVLALLAKLDATLRQAVADFDFNTYVRSLIDFCNEDLSAFYFDVRKDSLYCDAPTDPRRRACRTVLDTLFHALVRYAAPVLVFTAEEVWGTRFPDAGSVHLLEWVKIPATAHSYSLRHPREGGDPSPDLASGETLKMDPRLRGDDELWYYVEGERRLRWDNLRAIRIEVSEAIEPKRRDKLIGSSLEAAIKAPFFDAVPDLADILITGPIAYADMLQVTRTTDQKCGRCWRHLPEVVEDGDLCNRCTDAVATREPAQ